MMRRRLIHRPSIHSLRTSLSIALAALIFCAPAQAQQRSAPTATAEEYLQRTAEAYGLAASDLTELAVTDSYVSRSTGTTHVYLRQQVGGIPVVGGEFTVALDREGRAVHAVGRGAVLASQQDLAVSPSLSASEAANTLALDAGLAPSEAFRTLRSEGERAPVVTLSDAGVAQQPVTAKLVYYLQASGALALAWEVELEERGAPHYWLGYVDAVDGRVLARHDLVVHDTFGPSPAIDLSAERAADHPPSASAVARWVSPLVELNAHKVDVHPRHASESASYRVYEAPLESPLWATTAPPGDARTLVTDPHDPVASPYGWHDTNGVDGAEFSITRGNNVHAYTDVDGDDVADQGSSPNGDQNGVFVFDFPVSLTQDPSTYRPAAVTNLFYWSNVIHDVMYRYGFDEPAGNFQVNNYGNGGIGGDDVRAEAQDASVLGGGNCNANFSTPSDGFRPRMQMYTCDIASPDTDGDFDNGVIVHEYGHGISTRLTGGPSTSGCLTGNEQMGEGWSDFYGLVFTMDDADTRTTSRPIGNYLIGQSQVEGGIRPAPYNTSFSVNNYTYGDTNGGGLSIPHGIGFVWATALWEMTWDLIDAHGFDPDLYYADGEAGNQVAMRLVTDGLKLQPCNPGFVDGRDAILMADTLAFGGAYSAIIWEAFARRGLGVSASQGSSGSNTDNVEAFDTPLAPPTASVSPSQIYATVAPGDATSEYVILSNTAASGSGNLNWSAAITNVVSPSMASRPVVAPSLTAEAGLSLGSSADLPEQRKGEDRLAGTGSVNLTGGPDAFGYTFIDSGEPGGPAVVFQDIANIGTPVSWTQTGGFPGGDEGFDDVSLPFAFPFYGTERTSVRVFTNGFLTFSSFASNSFNNAGLPSTTPPNAIIAPFWDDLDQSAGGAVYTGTLPDGRFVVQYDAVPRFNTSNPVTFQVILAEDGTIEFQYEEMTGVLNAATVGIENDAGTAGLPVVVDASYVTSNKAVRIVPPPVRFIVSPTDGFIAAGDYDYLEVAFVASPSADGIYTADLVLTTNDPDVPSIVIPLELDVTSSLALGVRVMLVGAYDSANGVMRTDLAGGGHLPTGQPFASKGYAGVEIADEGVFDGPEPPVDWVLLHLRATPGGATLASRAALVLGDGSVVDVDGASPVAFVGEPGGAYYLVVEAQNHLAVMSASAVDLSGGSASYDFTTALSQAYPGGASPAMRQVGSGVWALWPGDANGDGQVTAPDFNGWSAATAAGTTGYDAADFNLDGQVTAPDFNLWSAATTAGAETAVPPPGFGPGAFPAFVPTGLPVEAGPRGVPALGSAVVPPSAPRSTLDQ